MIKPIAKVLGLLGFSAFILNGCAHPKPVETNKQSRLPAFASKRANEAVLTFSHRVELESPSKPTKADALQQIENQVVHLFGPMERAVSSAAPKEDHVLKITSIQKKDKDIWEIYYDYTGTIVVETGPKRFYDLYLPVNPDTIYQATLVGDTSLCTDDHYNSEDDFWYFWSPAPTYPKCKLKERNSKNPDGQYEVVRGTIDRLPAEKTTYPEYHRLASKEGVIDIHLFFGMDEPERSHDPMRSKDVGAEAYRIAKRELMEMGYHFKRWAHSQVEEIMGGVSEKDAPWVEEAVQEFPARGVKIRIRMFFGETEISQNAQGFHYFYKDAIENASLMIYDGHSGLGGNLDLDRVADMNYFKFKFNQKKYQIFFFNSCTSYTYYNTLYFQRKRKTKRKVPDPKGTKNLDILANGLSTAFDEMGSSNAAVVRAIHFWAEKGTWTSYQRMAKTIDSDNLFTVNGDEDNPSEPVR